MQRDLSKAIEEYNALCKSKGGNFGCFYCSDLTQLRNIATDKGGISFWDIVYHAIDSSLAAGFMIGYKAAKREQRQQLRTN